MDIERLTARNKNGLAYLVNVKPNEQEVDSPHKNTLKCILDCFERLAQYEDEAIVRQSVKSDIGETSDGYHTFNELYEHRTALFATLCNMRSDISWKSMKHADGTMYEGMFIAGIETPEGQYTYHCEAKYWYMFAMTKEIDKAPAYDGHQPSDYPRLLALSENSPYHQSVKSGEVAISKTETTSEPCEYCRKPIYLKWNVSFIDGYYKLDADCNYCPNCGRRLEETI